MPLSLHEACRAVDTELDVVRQLLDEGNTQLDEKDENGDTALMLASRYGRTEVVQLLLGKGAAIDVNVKYGITALLPGFLTLDEDQLGCMAAALAQGQLLKKKGAAMAVLQLVHLAGAARERALKLRSSDPRSADDHQALFVRLQLAAAACIQNDEYGKARGESDAHKLLRSDNGRKALEHAVRIQAKELLAQPVVQAYMKETWRGDLVNLGWRWVPALLVLLLQLLIFLPLVALVPALDHWLVDDKLESSDWHGKLQRIYLLRLPAVKFGLECAADLALALALRFVTPAALATAPGAPLLLGWVGSGLLWEACQGMASRVYDRRVAYWGDSINRVDATALIFSFAALIASLSSSHVFAQYDEEEPAATSLRAVAVFLLWLRAFRVLLISPKFGPFVMMFFRMLFDDLIKFMVLLFFLVVAFEASWATLLKDRSETDCADLEMMELLIAALTDGKDAYKCAQGDATYSPFVSWVLSVLFVALTAVLLLNMLIAMMAKTFDNISEASATNYIFLFSQRTLALKYEPPTPPPLNALGLPCEGMYLLWKWVQKQRQKRMQNRTEATPVADAAGRAAQGEQREDKETLAKKITEYILDNQDNSAQEERWRTTMKHETMKRFREQREAIAETRKAINKEHEAIAETRKEINKELKAIAETRETINKERNANNSRLDQQLEEVKKIVEEQFSKMDVNMDAKMDAKMEQLIKSIESMNKT